MDTSKSVRYLLTVMCASFVAVTSAVAAEITQEPAQAISAEELTEQLLEDVILEELGLSEGSSRRRSCGCFAPKTGPKRYDNNGNCYYYVCVAGGCLPAPDGMGGRMDGRAERRSC